MKTCFIFAALDCGKVQIEKNEGDIVVACDLGYKNAVENGIKPDIVVGDFDSLETVPENGNGDFELIGLSVFKADTDLSFAVKTGEERGCGRFVIFGALGGKRWDHTMANLCVLGAEAKKGRECFLVDGNSAITAVPNGKIEFSEKLEGTMGLVSFSDVSKGVTEKGFLYTIEDRDLESTHIMTVSNQFIGRKSSVEVKDGTLLIYFEGDYRLAGLCRQ